MVVDHGICDLDLRKGMELLVKTLLSLVVVGIMKFLAKPQVKANKTIINNSFVFGSSGKLYPQHTATK